MKALHSVTRGAIMHGMPDPQLISRSCTTGWFDWVWGDLWLTDDTLVRVSRGMSETREAAGKRWPGGSTVGPVDPSEFTERQRDGSRDRVIVLEEVRTGRLRRGIKTDRLSVRLRDGSRVKLLWLKNDPAYEVLRERLGGTLTFR